ncbi:DinI-like family protein [Hafnia paralvei]|uniref:DinI-like family protein n=1 Tax=Hafnia paralvei TaxID=546367 RepID=UPI0029DD6181|nr:DinI-like family protein [Hafnia paralvei]MDX6912282.1 DinI-like family protein [Hafnia paralvei]
MRVEVLFDKQAKVSQPVMAALTNELQKKISPQFPNARFRVASSSSTLLQITGTKNENDYEYVQSMIQEVWEDDSWLPS